MKINNHFVKLGEDFFQYSDPKPLENQRVAAVSDDVLQLLNLDEDFLKNQKNLDAIFGKKLNKKFCYLSQSYAGHQFGHFVDSLGDGRALLLWQIKNKKKQSFDLVLKGCGLTPFSRPYVQNADGRAVLRSSIREFLISEALYHLGIPTSRALCLIASDQLIKREKLEKAAQIIRVCESHIRFGSFEYFFYRKENDKVKELADYVLENYPEFLNGERENKYANFLDNVVKKCAKMIAAWQAFGFCHGVMNTDDFSIHGISFDFGPFAFLDEFNSNFICNSSDFSGRYSYKNQVTIALWNLNAFAITLSSLIDIKEIKEILEEFEVIFLESYHQLMAQKLGFSKSNKDVEKLIYFTLEMLEKNKIDYTNFFRNLDDKNYLLNMSSSQNWREELNYFFTIYNPNSKHLIKEKNPKFILRNYLLQVAIEKAENDDFSEVEKLLKISKNPFDEQKEFDSYAQNAPAYAKDLKISCSR